MTKPNFVTMPLVLMLALIASTTTSSVLAADDSNIEPAAVQTLKRMTDFTSGLKSFRATTQVTLEDLLDNNQRIDIDVYSKVVVERPNKIRAERVGEKLSQTFYYNGESVTLFNPGPGVYATEAAPETIEEMLDFSREVLGLTIPVADLVYRNAFAILMQKVISAAVVGQANIGGVSCTHLVFSRPDVDFQVWVASGEKPYPCKYVVTDNSTPQLLSTVTVMSDWAFNPEVDDSTFNFVPPEGATPVTFLPVDNELNN